jgi:hypothetical protein
MPAVIDPETMSVDELPGVWAPVQWEQTEEDRAVEIDHQAAASLLANVDVPEAILRLLLNETEAEETYGPPPGYKPDQQGEWDPGLITFAFRRPLRLVQVDRMPNTLTIEYDFVDLGHWVFEITPERVIIERI